eukprot:1152566-Amphidinium_carterae.3
MPWENPKAVSQLINSLKTLGDGPGTSNRKGGTTPAGRRGGTMPGQQSVQKGSKKWSAQSVQVGTVRTASWAGGTCSKQEGTSTREENPFLLDLPNLGNNWSTGIVTRLPRDRSCDQRAPDQSLRAQEESRG